MEPLPVSTNGYRLGALVRAARQRASPPLTQRQLAAAIGVDQRTISAIERGHVRGLNAAVANALCDTVPLSMSELVRSLGYALPQDAAAAGVADITENLAKAPPQVLDAIRLLLAGWQATRRSRSVTAPN